MKVSVMLVAAFAVLAVPHRARSANLFDGGLKDTGNRVLGVSAQISTPPVPNLHGGETSCAWAMVCKSDGTKYAQAGFTVEQAHSDTLMVFAQWTYAAGGPPGERKYRAPDAGSHTYKCTQNSTNGNWTFCYDNIAFATTTNTNWEGTAVEFMGEVVTAQCDTPQVRTVQMVGDEQQEAHKVNFTTLRYLPGVGACANRPTGCVWPGEGCGKPSTVWPDVWANQCPDWGQSKGAGYFKIWDKTP